MGENTPRPLTAASFNQFLAQEQLMATRCAACGALYLPPRAICPACYSEALAWEPLAGHGHLVAFTSIYVGPSALIAQGYGRDNPYCTGVVELAEGVKISARILGVDARQPASIPIGAPVQVAFLHEGEGDTRKTVLAFRTVE